VFLYSVSSNTCGKESMYSMFENKLQNCSPNLSNFNKYICNDKSEIKVNIPFWKGSRHWKLRILGEFMKILRLLCDALCHTIRHSDLMYPLQGYEPFKIQRIRSTKFNSHRFYVLPTQCIYVFGMNLWTNSDYFPIHNYVLPFITVTECFLRGTNWMFKHTSRSWQSLKGSAR
jgi:hypothetical protein